MNVLFLHGKLSKCKEQVLLHICTNKNLEINYYGKYFLKRVKRIDYFRFRSSVKQPEREREESQITVTRRSRVMQSRA